MIVRRTFLLSTLGALTAVAAHQTLLAQSAPPATELEEVGVCITREIDRAPTQPFPELGKRDPHIRRIAVLTNLHSVNVEGKVCQAGNYEVWLANEGISPARPSLLSLGKRYKGSFVRCEGQRAVPTPE